MKIIRTQGDHHLQQAKSPGGGPYAEPIPGELSHKEKNLGSC